MDLFEYVNENEYKKENPLADRLRPKKLEDIVGQSHILGKDKLLYKAIKEDKLSSIILYGPPGVGKTTIAKVISEETNFRFRQINAVTSGIKDIKESIKEALDEIKYNNRKTILFIDEIHRFNKSQQDSLLPYVENGTVILIGATTENPYFEVNKALISRMMVFELNELQEEDIVNIIEKALSDEEYGYGKLEINITKEVVLYISKISGGDARLALNFLEGQIKTSKMNEDGKIEVLMESILKQNISGNIKYGKNSNEHYDTISAFIKSIRGSDPDASVYWLGKMIYGGEDPKYIARRLIILASEDIGNADPNALNIAVSAFEGINVVGMPEGRIILAQAVIYLASAPKSNSSYIAINSVLEDLEKGNNYSVPKHISNTHIGYRYPHDYPKNYVIQDYLPKELDNKKYYIPSENGYERKIKERLSKLGSNNVDKTVD